MRPPDTTYGISSDLTGAAHAAAIEMWDVLEKRYGLSEARCAASPHVSYVVGDAREPDALAARLAAVAPRVAPVDIEIDGLGVFDGLAPALFLPAIRADLERRPTRLPARLERLDLVHVVFPRHVYVGRFRLAPPPGCAAP